MGRDPLASPLVLAKMLHRLRRPPGTSSAACCDAVT